MKTTQFSKSIRRSICLGQKYIMSDFWEVGSDNKHIFKKRPYICIGKYAHIATFRQTVPPYLTKSYTWFDLNEMVVNKKMERMRDGTKKTKSCIDGHSDLKSF